MRIAAAIVLRQDTLIKMGYTKQKEEDYDNYVYPLEMKVSVNLPEGFKLLYGEEYEDEENRSLSLKTQNCMRKQACKQQQEETDVLK